MPHMESLLGNTLDAAVANHSFAADHLVCRHHTARIPSNERAAANGVSSFRNLAWPFEFHVFRIGRVLVHLYALNVPWFSH